MSTALRAALLSALIFPGVGHFSLKKPLQGSLLFGISGVGLAFFMTLVMDLTKRLSIKLTSGELPLDVVAIREQVAQQLAVNEHGIGIVSWVLLICWLVGVVDAYRIGWGQQRAHGSHRDKQDQPG